MPDPSEKSGSPAPTSPVREDELATGLPWFKTWRGVYRFVLGTFLLWVVLLVLLTRFFS